MATWRGQSRGNVLGYKIFVIVLRYTGLTPAYFILCFVAAYFFLFAPASFRQVFSFYRTRMRFSFGRAVLAVYRNYYAFGQVLLDKTAMLAGFGAKFTFDFDGEEHLRNMASAHTGCLLVSAHIGNFEMAGHMLKRLQASVNIVMLDAEHQQIRQYLDRFTRRSFRIIPVREDNSHIYEIKRVLENREILCIHGDRFIEGSRFLEARFLGEDAAFPTGPFHLAVKYGVPVSFVFAMKESRRHYHFYATKPGLYPQQASPSKRDEGLRAMIGDYVRTMEEKIRQYPYQWFNYYDFWARHKPSRN